jgi:hypothetical protein
MASAVDRQQSILQTNITERIQQVQQQHPDMQQRYFEIQLAQERRKMMKKINDPGQMDRVRMRKDEEEGQGKKKRKKSDSPLDDTLRETSSEAEPHSHIDIKV